MPATEARRRLAAILAADVVGYSRLMETAESATLDRLKRLRTDVFDPLVATHDGRLVKLMGDGALVEFPSVVEAVKCAIEVQRGAAGFEPECPVSQRIHFRIGINLGDVLVEGDDLYGDGVNIAARIQALAEPDSVVLSSAAYDQVTGKLPFVFRDLGEHTLKNMSRPLRLYALAETERFMRSPSGKYTYRKGPMVAVVAAALIVSVVAAWFSSNRLWPAPAPTPTAPKAERPRIAVLPFRNLGLSSDTYFADGLTEDIATNVAKFDELAVIDPAASAIAAQHSSDPAVVGQELGARYLIRGTLRRDEQHLRINAQLVEVPAGTIRWSKSYDVTSAEVFAVQDDITRQLAGTMAVRLDQLEQARATGRPPDSLGVYEMVLHGRNLLDEGTQASNRKGREILAKAVARDPEYAPAQVALGTALFQQAIGGWTEFPADALDQAEAAAHAAIALDPDLASANRLLGTIYLSRGQFDLALTELDRALAHNPSDAGSYEMRGEVLMLAGDHAAAITSLLDAQKLDPSLGYGDLGWCYFLESRFEDAVAMLTRAMPAEPSPTARDGNLAVLAAAYAELGRSARAAETKDRLYSNSPFFDPQFFVSQFRSAADRQRILDGFAKAGIGQKGQHKAD